MAVPEDGRPRAHLGHEVVDGGGDEGARCASSGVWMPCSVTRTGTPDTSWA
ncbi:hypothetical protein ABTY20_25110 [Streptomyces sp. NPDC126497]|uniref:hypothetical protein n=1 Tax=Streptomyces sp. NPDC126497 TaxID=3155313 RepID=UPI00333292DF